MCSAQMGPELNIGINEVKSKNITNCGVRRIKRNIKNLILLNLSALPSVFFRVI
jgi:hypothetical protein